MIKDTLVLLAGSPSDDSALETAFLLARIFGARMDCLHVRPGAEQIIVKAAVGQFTATIGNVDLLHSIERAVAQTSKAARRSFDAFCDHRNFLSCKDGFERDGVSASFREILGDDVGKTIRESRFNDLTFVSRGSRNGGLSTTDIGSILISAGRPIVLAPSEAPENLAPTVAIAWKETAEAARAVGAAMPLLRKADRVFVLAGDEGEALAEGMESAVRLVAHLRRHGISAQPKAVLAAGRALPEAILETAGELRSNLLVSGAYGHSRARELVFGGFTRHIIKEARLPVFLFH